MVRMPVEFRHGRDELTALVSGELDHHNAAEIRVMTDGELERCTPHLLIFDMGGVTFMDSSGVGLILGRARTMHQWDGRIKIINAPERVTKILKLSGLGALISKKKTETAEGAERS